MFLLPPRLSEEGTNEEIHQKFVWLYLKRNYSILQLKWHLEENDKSIR